MMNDSSDEVIRRAAAELRRPIADTAQAKARLKEALSREGLPTVAPPYRGPALAWRRAGMAMAAALVGVVALSSLRAVREKEGATAATSLRDGVARSLLDTLRLVQFMIEAPRAKRVGLAGDFNEWDATATQLRAENGRWSAIIALPPGRHRYSFVLDDTNWVGDPARGVSDTLTGGRPVSTMVVARGMN